MAAPSLPQNGGSRLYGGLHRSLRALVFAWIVSFLISCQYRPFKFGRSAQPAPGAQAHQHQPAAAASGGTRWNSGNSWASRFKGAPVNTRGSGNAWQRGSRKVPGQYSVNKNATPSQPASSWQKAPYYTQQPAQAPAAPSYGYAAGGAAGYQGYGVSNTPNYGAAAAAASYGNASNYTIRSGDTLSGIARSYKVTVPALRQANNLTGDQIFRGATLIIPGR